MRSARRHRQEVRHHRQAEHEMRRRQGRGGTPGMFPGAPTSPAPGPGMPSAMLARAILEGGLIDGRYQPPAQRITQYVPPTLPSVVAPGSPIVITIRNVGYLKRVRMAFSMTVTGGGTTTSTRTKLGLANLFSNVTLQDYAGNRRINCDGWLLVYLAASRRLGYGAEGGAYTSDTPLGIANNNPGTVTATQWAGWNCPSSITSAATAVVTGVIDIPLTPGGYDLRGLLDAQVTEVVTTITATINPNFACTSSADPTFSVFQSGGTDLVTISNFSLLPYQHYLYDLPKNAAGQELAPVEDIATGYYLETVPFAILNNNVDNAYQYVNRRRFLSTFAIFDNGGTLNFGTDVNFFKILSASQTPILQVDPHTQLYEQRLFFGADLPPGMYYWDQRGAPEAFVPIDTRVFGNMQWVLQPNVVNTGASVRFGFEQLVSLGDVREGPSLASR